jgi:hypothetical protein
MDMLQTPWCSPLFHALFTRIGCPSNDCNEERILGNELSKQQESQFREKGSNYYQQILNSFFMKDMD